MDHSGHRERLKQRYLSEGLASMGEDRTLEMLLFYCVPRKDTYPLAKALLKQFGSLREVLEAPREALEQVEGIGPSVATYLNFISATYRCHFAARKKERLLLNSVEKCGDFMQPYFTDPHQEAVCVLCLDAQCHPKGCKLVMLGDVNTVNVPIRKIVEFASACKAASVVLGHNHPGGVALPSQNDIASTKLLMAALRSVDIRLADHLIFADDDFLSMKQSGLLSKTGPLP